MVPEAPAASGAGGADAARPRRAGARAGKAPQGVTAAAAPAPAGDAVELKTGLLVREAAECFVAPHPDEFRRGRATDASWRRTSARCAAPMTVRRRSGKRAAGVTTTWGPGVRGRSAGTRARATFAARRGKEARRAARGDPPQEACERESEDERTAPAARQGGRATRPSRRAAARLGRGLARRARRRRGARVQAGGSQRSRCRSGTRRRTSPRVLRLRGTREGGAPASHKSQQGLLLPLSNEIGDTCSRELALRQRRHWSLNSSQAPPSTPPLLDGKSISTLPRRCMAVA